MLACGWGEVCIFAFDECGLRTEVFDRAGERIKEYAMVCGDCVSGISGHPAPIACSGKDNCVMEGSAVAQSVHSGCSPLFPDELQNWRSWLERMSGRRGRCRESRYAAISHICWLLAVQCTTCSGRRQNIRHQVRVARLYVEMTSRGPAYGSLLKVREFDGREGNIVKWKNLYELTKTSVFEITSSRP
jgi:hypothetical protein